MMDSLSEFMKASQLTSHSVALFLSFSANNQFTYEYFTGLWEY